MTANEVSQEFGIPLPTIYRLVREKKIPYRDVSPEHTVQRRVVFSRDAIAEWRKKRTAQREGA